MLIAITNISGSQAVVEVSGEIAGMEHRTAISKK